MTIAIVTVVVIFIVAAYMDYHTFYAIKNMPCEDCENE